MKADHGSYFVTTLDRTKKEKERRRRNTGKKNRQKEKITLLR